MSAVRKPFVPNEHARETDLIARARAQHEARDGVTRASEAESPRHSAKIEADANAETFASVTLASAERGFSAPPPGSFAGYQILREIHRGGQGVVYQAVQKSTNRKVAIK